MIKESKKKLHLVEYGTTKKHAVKDNSPHVSLNTKYSMLSFNAEALREMGMANKFVKLYHDTAKKVIAWKIIDMVKQELMKEYKLVKVTPSTGQWKVSVSPIVSSMQTYGLKKEHTYKVPVQSYKELGDTYFFIELVDEVKMEVTYKKNGMDSEPEDTGTDSGEGVGGEQGEGTEREVERV